MEKVTDDLAVLDLGDAKVETKQKAPIPPYYQDSTYGFGWRPN